MKKIDKPLYVNVGRQLKEARLNKGYSLQEVADLVGKNKTTIKRYEDATVRVDMDTLKKIADVLGMSVMTPSVTYDGETYIHQIGLYPKLEEMLKYDKTLQRADEYFNDFTAKFVTKFTHLDINLQKSILIMMDFTDDEINELMKFLH